MYKKTNEKQIGQNWSQYLWDNYKKLTEGNEDYI